MRHPRLLRFLSDKKNRLTVRYGVPSVGLPLAILVSIERHARALDLPVYSMEFVRSLVSLRFIGVFAVALVIFGWGVSRLFIEGLSYLGIHGGDDE